MLFSSLRSSILAEFAKGSAAQLYSQLVMIGSQLLVLPIMLRTWGPEIYGGWLAIDALRMVFALTDLGLAQIAANQITELIGGSKYDDAKRVNSSAWAMLVGAAFIVISLSALVSSRLPIAGFLKIEIYSSEVGLTFFVLSLVACGSVLFGIVGAGLRAVGLYWLMTATNATYQLATAAALAFWGIAGGGYLEVALTILVVQWSLFILAGMYLLWHHEWARPSWSLVDFNQIRVMIAPSFAYMLYYFTNLVTIQGVNILVSTTLGPAAVTIVAAIRTLTRVGRMFASIAVYALEPIFARLKGQKDNLSGQSIYRMLVLAGVVGSVIYWATMVIYGPTFLNWWTNGVVVGYNKLLILMTTAITIEIVWFTLQTPYVSTNRHAVFAYAVAAFGITSTLACWPLLSILGLEATGWSLLGMHFLILTTTLFRMRSNPPFLK